MANLNGIAGQIVGDVTTGLLNRMDPYVNALGKYRELLKLLKSGEVVLAQVQIMEDGEFRLIPPPQPITTETCDERATKAMEPVANNGKKDEVEVPEPVGAVSDAT